MFSKHVWYDRKHQAEVYAADEGSISGTLVAYEGCVVMINPRPDILVALYQEAKIKRILSVRAIILTGNSMDVMRGLCAFVNYSRGLRRRSPLAIISRSRAGISDDFLRSCCAKLWGDFDFEVDFVQLRESEPYTLGKGNIAFVPAAGESSPELLEILTRQGTRIHYYDESHRGPIDDVPVRGTDAPDGHRPDVVIRAARLPAILHEPPRLMAVDKLPVLG